MRWLVDGRVREGFEAMVAALVEQGRLERVDEGYVSAGRVLADVLDENPRSPGLWERYVEVLDWLRVVGDDGDPDEFEQLLAALRSGAEVGDSED